VRSDAMGRSSALLPHSDDLRPPHPFGSLWSTAPVVQLPNAHIGLEAVDAAWHKAWATFAKAVADVDVAIVRHGTFGKNGQAH